jgi:predicted cupin superfamily sugar epimerase
MIDLRDPKLPADKVIAALGLQPHPEGGHFRETWRDHPADGTRGAGTAILFLLALDQFSHWHRVDAAELWIWQAGAPLVLSVSPDGHDASAHWLGPDLGARQSLHHVVPAFHWQAATSLGAWTLVTCTVSPAFRFEGFEMAPPDWRPMPRGGKG